MPDASYNKIYERADNELILDIMYVWTVRYNNKAKDVRSIKNGKYTLICFYIAYAYIDHWE